MYSSTSTYSDPSGIQGTPGGKPVLKGKSTLDCFTFGMVQPGRSYNSGDYRYGYQGSEKDDEIKGNGNSYTTYFRQLDPRLGRWFSMDPKASPGWSPYVSMQGNPIRHNDVLGDTIIVTAGNEEEIQTIIGAINDQFNSDVCYDMSCDSENNTVAKIYGDVGSQGDERFNELRGYLNEVVGNSETLSISVFRNTPNRIDDIEMKGGLWSFGNNIEVTDSYVSGDWSNSGGRKARYEYIIDGGIFSWEESFSRGIPLSEGIGHEILHYAGSLLGEAQRVSRNGSARYYNEENRVIGIMNSWRQSMNIPQRPTYVESNYFEKWAGYDLYRKKPILFER